MNPFVESVILIFAAVMFVKWSQIYLEKANYGSKLWYAPNAFLLLSGIAIFVIGVIMAFKFHWWAPLPAMLCTGVVMGLLRIK